MKNLISRNISNIRNRLARNIRRELRNHRALYSLARSLKSFRTDLFYKLVCGYYEDAADFVSFIVERRGDMYPDVIVYHISATTRGFEIKGKISQCNIGLFGLFRHVLQGLIISESLGAVPVVEIGTNSAYHDPGMDGITKNVFEYYFEPVSDIKYTDVNLCSKVITYCEAAPPFFMDFAARYSNTYKISSDNIEKMARVYKKYIRLNQETDRIISENISDCLKNKKTLGVHVRGTDFNFSYGGHPNVISISEYLENTKEVYGSGGYDQVFLATDDANALEAFREEFGDSLVWYSDTFRSSDSVGAHWKDVGTGERPLHHYKLGLEVIRDVYTLAACDSLICGLSQVAYAARYVKLAQDERYSVLRVLDHGVRND